jgi:hypothetical protein
MVHMKMPAGSWLLGSNPIASIAGCTVAWASAIVIAEQTSVTKLEDAGPTVGAAPSLGAASVDATAEDAGAPENAEAVAAGAVVPEAVGVGIAFVFA